MPTMTTKLTRSNKPVQIAQTLDEAKTLTGWTEAEILEAVSWDYYYRFVWKSKKPTHAS